MSSTRLSRDRILATALELVDDGGVDALSMRRLAQALDVWPMAVYRYFQDKDALLAALVEVAADRIAAPPTRGPWRRRITALLTDARLGLGGHDAAGAADRLGEAGLAILADAGLTGEAAERAWRILFGYAIGFAGNMEDFAGGLDLLLDGLTGPPA